MKVIHESIEVAAQKSKGALLIGGGGGGDVIQTLPMMNYLKILGIQNMVLANTSVSWWEGLPGLISWGGDVYNVKDLTETRYLDENIAQVSGKSVLASGPGKGQQPWEAVIADLTDAPVYTVGVQNGTKGMVEGLKTIVNRYEIDMVIGVDNGSDSFYSGSEKTIDSPLIDAMVLAAILQLDIPAYYALGGYGCDAEMTIQQLNKNVATVMRERGFLGAHGLTPEDIEALDPIFKDMPDERLLKWAYMAAKGNLGSGSTKGNYPIEVTPLTALFLFFDPKVIVDKLNPLPNLVAKTKSLKEAEGILLKLGLVPETRRPLFMRSMREESA